MKKLLAIILVLSLVIITSVYAAPAVMNPDRVAPINIQSATFNVAPTSAAIIVPAVAGKVIKVFSVLVSGTVSTTAVNFRNGTVDNIDQPQVLNGALRIESVTPPAFLFSTSSGTALYLVTSGAGTAVGRVSYWQDDSN